MLVIIMLMNLIENKLFGTIISGIIKGLKMTGLLLLIMIPVFLLTVLVKFSPIMPFLEEMLSPMMKIFDLPGTGGIPIIAGFFGDEYSVVAAMRGFSFTSANITTISMIILCFHSIPVETAITKAIGFATWKTLIFRVCLAIFSGFLTMGIYNLLG
jgi:Fe2+ transport system protein B